MTAGQNAAIEEVNAYERDARTAQRDNEFLSQIKRGVASRSTIDKALTKHQNSMTVSEIRLTLLVNPLLIYRLPNSKNVLMIL